MNGALALPNPDLVQHLVSCSSSKNPRITSQSKSAFQSSHHLKVQKRDHTISSIGFVAMALKVLVLAGALVALGYLALIFPRVSD